MSATLTKFVAGSEAIAEAQAVFTRARGTQWPEGVRRALGEPGMDLAVALKHYHELRNGIVPPWFPGILAGPEGFEQALRLAADNAWEKAEEVTAVIAEHEGSEAA